MYVYVYIYIYMGICVIVVHGGRSYAHLESGHRFQSLKTDWPDLGGEQNRCPAAPTHHRFHRCHIQILNI